MKITTEQREGLLKALADVRSQLDGRWPVPYRRKIFRLPHMIGYSRGKGRREIKPR